ncbi:hypothetical protein AXF42_Ash009586 [Apostasia shenzhenica]|uniref:Myb-like domain-containing protein n=1 Tax=Apostasia shenzhenica TaxID=1088818 RepID=A0A2I0B981_9ASPA|nr:hypothetical protein AXF42_Ash009586 [Apostasia shenzhenica]
MANAAVVAGLAAGNGSEVGRVPRLPRWTRQEILVLIEGKRVVESRGRGRAAAAAAPVEPKWAAVSAYCRRHGVNRGPVQCRKRWSNLAGDYRKIKEWEAGRAGRGEAESFWMIRNDVRRERKLPGFFDREVYDILDGAAPMEALVAVAMAGAGAGKKVEEEDEDVVFDSGRSAADDGLFSDFEEDKEAEEEEEDNGAVAPFAVAPISEKKLESFHQQCSNPGASKDKQQDEAENSISNSLEPEMQKRRRTSPQVDDDDISLHSKLIEILDRNNKMLIAQLEAQNINSQLDREQRKDQADGLLSVLNKLADALGRIADKL